MSLKKAGSKLEHQGIKIEFIGQIELFYDRGNHHEFTSLVKELARPGEMITNTSYPFEFSCVEKPFEVYTGWFYLFTKGIPNIFCSLVWCSRIFFCVQKTVI